VLAFLGFVLAVVAEVVGAGKVVALAFTGAAGALLLYVSGTPRVFVRKPMRVRRVSAAVLIALAVAGGLYTVTLSILLSVIPAIVAGGFAWRVADPRLPRLRPFTVQEALQPSVVVPLMLMLLLLVVFGLLGRIRVLAEYALALAGLIVIVRMFAVIWFRLAEQADQVTLRRTTIDGPTATQLLVGAAAVLAITILIFVPLGLSDPGLLLLFFSAATIAALVGLSGFGARGALLGRKPDCANGRVLPADASATVDADRPGTERLTTPEIRYAAALHDGELQQHLLKPTPLMRARFWTRSSRTGACATMRVSAGRQEPATSVPTSRSAA
jgi:hypothetical protein